MSTIIVEVGETRIETPNAQLARQVLEQAAGISPSALVAGEFVIATTWAPPAIGENWPGQGGVYAGLMRGENGQPDYHLVIPTEPAASVEEITWGAQGEREDAATSDFDGLANTRALVTSQHQHPAAEWAAGLEIDGHSDFYLPARRELRLCWVNVPELFAEGWHWSSTQYSPRYAWTQYFGGGYQYVGHKDNALRARAVRRVLTTSPL